jgi:phage tail P2-like protein
MSFPKLQEFKFRDLLPSSVRDAKTFVAAAQCLDELLAETHARVKNTIIYARIDELDEPLLSNLAWQFNLDGYEGYALAETPEEKRALVKNAIQLKWHKGTRWSVERVFELLDMRGRITEWWESGESTDTFPPYTFDIEIDVHRAINEKLYGDLGKLIDALKNVRSHLRKLTLNWCLRPCCMYVGAQALWGTELTLYPLMATDFEIRADAPHIAPYHRMEIELKFAPAKSIATAGAAAANVALNPKPTGRFTSGKAD